MSEENPLLKKIQMPGRRFRLPSRGYFYKDNELADTVIDGEVEVLSMTAVDEVSLRSPEFLFNGEAIQRVFTRCIPEVKKPLKLLSKDVDFLLTALRIVSYGDALEVRLRCDECQNLQNVSNIKNEELFITEISEKADEQDVSFELALMDQKVMQKLNDIRNKKVPKRPYTINLNGVIMNQTTEISPDEHSKYKLTLSNGQIVTCTPIKMNDAVMSYQFQNENLNRDLDKAEDYIAFIMASCVLSVETEYDGKQLVVNSPVHIAEWAKQLPIMFKDELTSHMSLLDEWGTNFDYNLECPDCGHVSNASTLLNPITFFMQPSNQDNQS